jgi:hypothetical protein
MEHPAKVSGTVDKGTALQMAHTFPSMPRKLHCPRKVPHRGFAAVQDDIQRSVVSFAQCNRVLPCADLGAAARVGKGHSS